MAVVCLNASIADMVLLSLLGLHVMLVLQWVVSVFSVDVDILRAVRSDWCCLLCASVSLHPLVCVCCVVQTGNGEDGSTETTAEAHGPQQGRGDAFPITQVTHTYRTPYSHTPLSHQKRLL